MRRLQNRELSLNLTYQGSGGEEDGCRTWRSEKMHKPSEFGRTQAVSYQQLLYRKVGALLSFKAVKFMLIIHLCNVPCIPTQTIYPVDRNGYFNNASWQPNFLVDYQTHYLFTEPQIFHIYNCWRTERIGSGHCTNWAKAGCRHSAHSYSQSTSPYVTDIKGIWIQQVVVLNYWGFGNFSSYVALEILMKFWWNSDEGLIDSKISQSIG